MINQAWQGESICLYNIKKLFLAIYVTINNDKIS